MICSLAVCDALSEAVGPRKSAGLAVGVKWPNDVLIGERKVCGILTELDVQEQRIRHAIVGIGINVNVDFQGAPPLMVPATSLSIEAGHPVSRLEVLVALLTGIERRYLALMEGQSFHQEWAERMATLGHPVQVSGASEALGGPGRRRGRGWGAPGARRGWQRAARPGRGCDPASGSGPSRRLWLMSLGLVSPRGLGAALGRLSASGKV